MSVQSIRFLALGDSYTIGEGVPPDECWPIQLAQALQAVGEPVDDPIIIARTGWTTGELHVGIRETVPAGNFELVSLQIGVNNQYRGSDLETYRNELHDLLVIATGFAGGDVSRVMLLSIPDWGVTPFAEGHDREQIAAEIDAFNAANRAECNHLGARYMDVTPISRLAGQDASLMAPDGLHPSGKMYAAWVEKILPTALEILGAEKP